MDIFIEVLKWGGIVLVAGFVGYFGRYLAMLFIDKIRKKKAPSAPEPASETSPSPETQLEETRLKLGKKRTKAEAKKAKKTPNK